MFEYETSYLKNKYEIVILKSTRYLIFPTLHEKTLNYKYIFVNHCYLR